MVGLLGTGSFAAVYRANDPALDAPVAIKVLADHHSAVPEIRERFVREARLLRRLGTDRLVTVHDIGETDGQPYFVMELFDAGTLADRVREGHAVSFSALSHVVTELGAGLQAVHEGGVVHRDIKPSNVLIRRASTESNDVVRGVSNEILAVDEQLVLGDFGLARDAELTTFTIGGGTEGFAAPEQRLPSSTIDHRADLYSATALVTSLLIGATPSSASDVAAGGIGGSLRRELERGLAADANDRHADIDEWTSRLSAALSQDTSPAPASARRSARSFATAALVAAVVLVLAAAIGVALIDRSGADNGPIILGPSELVVGRSAVFSFEATPGATYFWTDAAGTVYREPSLQVSPSSSGVVEVTLTETNDGDSRSTTQRLRVRDEP